MGGGIFIYMKISRVGRVYVQMHKFGDVDWIGHIGRRSNEIGTGDVLTK